ncbi:MAG: hypothetical protein LBH06_02890 [Rikenellaceae bacterium]|jgi:Zn-dependent oligopeptidase|nr:hypothetical protein [Rikenellaceae bacterium]
MKYLHISLLMLLPISSAVAQPPYPNSRTRQEMLNLRIDYIVAGLNLHDDRQARLRSVYTKYNEELVALEQRMIQNRADTADLTNEKAEQRILNEFDCQKKNIQLREKYYGTFRTFLSPTEVLRMYRLEREMRSGVSREMHRRSKPDGPDR